MKQAIQIIKYASLLAVTCSLVRVTEAWAGVIFTLPVPSPATQNPHEFAKWLFEISLALVAIAGFSAFLYGGIRYITAAGNPSRAEDAKDRLIHALLGLLLVAFSGIALRLINPDLSGFGEVDIPSVTIKTNLNPPAGAPQGSYLACKTFVPEGSYCAIAEGVCGDDPQCGPCVALAEGSPCTPAPASPSIEFLSCTNNIPCLAQQQGGSCAPNFPCSEITGGMASDWQVMPDTACLDPQNPVECTDGEPFAPGAHACCGLRAAQPPAGAPVQTSPLAVSCYATPNPAPANPLDPVNFGIRANGAGPYECRWSGAFEAQGCSPEHIFTMPGTYSVTVAATDLGTSQRGAASCSVVIKNYPFEIENTRTGLAGQTGVTFCPHDPWQITLTEANPQEPVFVKIWKDGAIIQDWLSLEVAVPDPLKSPAASLRTNDAGEWIASGSYNATLIADWKLQTSIRGVESPILSFAVKPCMRITNSTTGRTQWSIEPDPAFPSLCVEDPWNLEVIGPPDADVWIKRTFDGSIFRDWTDFSPPRTDGSGHWALPGNFNRCMLGAWTEQARLTDAGGTLRTSDILPFAVQSCLAVSCADLTVSTSVTPSFRMTGNISGDADFGGQVVPSLSHECYWIGPDGLAQGPPPSAALCMQSDPVNSAGFRLGGSLVTLRARDVVSDCATQASGMPQPQTPSYTDATCTLTIIP